METVRILQIIMIHIVVYFHLKIIYIRTKKDGTGTDNNHLLL